MKLTDLLFYSGTAALLTHELDAMTHHEWRLLPILKGLPDATAEPAFVAAHWPLFVLMLGTAASLNLRLRQTARDVICAFLVVHAGLHTFFSGDVLYTFSGTLSQLLIYCAGALGLAYSIIRWRESAAPA